MYFNAQVYVPHSRRIRLVCFALKLVSWWELDFSLVLQILDELFLINAPWSQVFSCFLKVWV